MASDSRSLTLVCDYLESASAKESGAAREALSSLHAAASKKLWHQLSISLLAALQNPAFTPALLLGLQENVVARIAKKLNPLEFVRWSMAVAALMGPEGSAASSAAAPAAAAPSNARLEAGLKHMESFVLPLITHTSAGQTSIEQDGQAVLLCQLEILRRQLALLPVGADADPIKEKLTEAKKTLDNYSGVMHARVYAHYYQAMYEYAKWKSNPQEYYSNALLFLTYTPLDSIPVAQQAALASDIGLAALLGKNIYNFGELLQHPILKSLDATEYAWLPKLLFTFNGGNIKEFNVIFQSVKDKYPTLAANTNFLNEKLRIMTLMELVFRLPSGSKSSALAQANSAASSSSSSSAANAAAAAVAALSLSEGGRFLSFSTISTLCDLPLDKVEWLLMKALSLRVIKGSMDEVAQQIRIKWVSPRVLDLNQIQSLKHRLNGWQQEVEQTTVFVENNAQHVI